ncbi:myb-related transcription factor, partner of profilin-like [Tachysurus ichikawai]
MATSEKRGKKFNFSDTEIETLVEEVEARKTVGTEQTVAELKKKWSGLKVEAKRKLSSHHQSVAATGRGPSTADLTSVDSKIAAIHAVHLSVWGDKWCQLFVLQSFRSLKLWVNRRFRVRGSQMQMHSVRLKAVPLLRLTRPKVVGYSLTQSCSYNLAVNRVADELWQMREVMQKIAQSLKDAVKT